MGDYELSILKGADLPYTLTIKDSSGDVQDITGWSFTLMVKNDINDTDASALISKAGVLTNPTVGIATITLDRTDTENLDYGEYTYNIQIIKDDGKYKYTPVDNFIISPVVKEGD